MANEEHRRLFRQGVGAWNTWRAQNPTIRPDLGTVIFYEGSLKGINLSDVNFADGTLEAAPTRLDKTYLDGANLSGVKLSKAVMWGVTLRRTDLRGAQLNSVDLRWAKAHEADFRGASLRGAQCYDANFSRAKFAGAHLHSANLSKADFTNADLRGADLSLATLVRTNFTNADLTGCRVYGISAWNPILDAAKQTNLIITNFDEPEITVDNLELAQFIYLLLHNEKVHNIIDTITSKAVLILGRFAPERKAILNALRDILREKNRTPIVFDFTPPISTNMTDTVKMLAQMARYIIVDLSDPNSAPYELGVISMLGLDSTPIVPIIASDQEPFAMLIDVLKKRWSTQLVTYPSPAPGDVSSFMFDLAERITPIAEAKVRELRGEQAGQL